MDINNNLDDGLKISYIKPGMHLWDKVFLENTISSLKKYQSDGNDVSKERCFTEFLLEIEQAYRVFLKKISDLPMIMKCRVKGDNKAHFGGQECAELVRALRASSEKYLKSTSFKSKNENNNTGSSYQNNDFICNDHGVCSIYTFAANVKNMAREDERKAKETEAKVYQEYVSLGKDHTLDALKQAGYTFGNE